MLEQASRQDVNLVAFPETFLSGYPFWVMLGGGGRFGDPDYARAYAAYVDAAVELNGPEMRQITEAARDLNVFVFLGSSERGCGAGEVRCIAPWSRSTHSKASSAHIAS
jgi:nitrilase